MALVQLFKHTAKEIQRVFNHAASFLIVMVFVAMAGGCLGAFFGGFMRAYYFFVEFGR